MTMTVSKTFANGVKLSNDGSFSSKSDITSILYSINIISEENELLVYS